MDPRLKELSQLKIFTECVDKEVTMILQSLQWDRKHLSEGASKVACKYDSNHRIPLDKREFHENACLLKSAGYFKEDTMLPDPLDSNSDTLIKFDKFNIMQIINKASLTDPFFKRGAGSQGLEPMTLERLQAAYTSDERRAIHDAAVAAAPTYNELTDVALPSDSKKNNSGFGTDGNKPESAPGGDERSGGKGRLQALAELRDMKRRRAKYRGATTRNYSDVLRDLIHTQMEVYSDAQVTAAPQASTLASEKLGYDSHPEHNQQAKETRHKYKEGSTNERYNKRNGSKDRKIYEDDHTENSLRTKERSSTFKNSCNDKYKSRSQKYQERERYSSSNDRNKQHNEYERSDKHRHDYRNDKYQDESKSRKRDKDGHESALSGSSTRRYPDHDSKDNCRYKKRQREYTYESDRNSEQKHTSYYNSIDLVGSDEKRRKHKKY